MDTQDFEAAKKTKMLDGTTLRSKNPCPVCGGHVWECLGYVPYSESDFEYEITYVAEAFPGGPVLLVDNFPGYTPWRIDRCLGCDTLFTMGK